MVDMPHLECDAEMREDPITQLVEYRSFKAEVSGPNPDGVTLLSCGVMVAPLILDQVVGVQISARQLFQKPQTISIASG